MPRDQVEERRLARAVRADDPPELSGLDPQTHVLQSVDAAETTAEPFDAEHRTSLGSDGSHELFLGPRRRDELAALDDVHGNELAREPGVIRLRVVILTVRGQERQLLERLLDLIAFRAVRLL